MMTTTTPHELEIAQYTANRAAEVPLVVEAYDLQQEIARDEAELSKKRDRLADMYEYIRANLRPQYFSLTEMRPRRSVDPAALMREDPDAFAALSHLSDADILEYIALRTSRDRAFFESDFRESDPEGYLTKCRVNVTDLERRIGKKEVKLLEKSGAVKTTYSAGKNAKLIYIGDHIAGGAGND